MMQSFINASKARRWKYAAAVCLCFIITALVSGCMTLPSERTAFPSVPNGSLSGGISVSPPEAPIDARAAVEEAVRVTNEDADTQKFWYTGYVRNTLEKHLVNSMFDGVAIRPKDTVLVNGRIAGQPFQLYSYEGEHFVRSRDVWYPVTEEQPLPLDPLAGFNDWLPLMEEAVKLPDTNVLGIPTNAYEVRITGKTWVESSPSPFFDELRAKVGDNETLERLLEQTIVKTTLKVGKDKPIIYEYDTWIVMPLPSGGYFDQRTFVQLFRYDDPSIERVIPSVITIREWMEEFEKRMAEEDELLEE